MRAAALQSLTRVGNTSADVVQSSFSVEQMEEEPMTELGYTLVKGKKKRANQKYSYPVGTKDAPR
jgi:hypothetical protein